MNWPSHCENTISVMYFTSIWVYTKIFLKVWTLRYYLTTFRPVAQFFSKALIRRTRKSKVILYFWDDGHKLPQNWDSGNKSQHLNELSQLLDACSASLSHEDEVIVSWQLNAVGKVQVVQQNFGRIAQRIIAQQSVQYIIVSQWSVQLSYHIYTARNSTL